MTTHPGKQALAELRESAKKVSPMIDNQILRFISSLTRFEQGSIGMRKAANGFYLDVADTAEALRPVFSALASEKARADAAEAERDRYRDALAEIANAFTAHGYSDAMDAVQALKDTAKEAIDAKR